MCEARLTSLSTRGAKPPLNSRRFSIIADSWENDIIGALAHVQIARAYALEADSGKAEAAYQDFLTLWKDADPDIPICKQAKAEYAKLQ